MYRANVRACSLILQHLPVRSTVTWAMGTYVSRIVMYIPPNYTHIIYVTMYTYLGLGPVSLCTCMLRVTMKKLAQNTLKHNHPTRSWGWSAFFLDARGICVLPFRFAGTQLTMIHRDWRLGFGHSTYTLVVLIEPRFQVGPPNAFFCVFRTPYTYECIWIHMRYLDSIFIVH